MNGRQEALKTYIEQTKILITLASGFVLGPAAAVSFVRPMDSQHSPHISLSLFLVAEMSLILSVLSGYAVLGSIAGSQHDEEFDVYRPATKYLSLLQVVSYIVGLLCFVFLVRGTVMTH